MQSWKITQWILILGSLACLVVINNLWLPFIDGKEVAYRGIAFGAVLFALIASVSSSEARSKLARKCALLARDPIFWAATAGIVLLVFSTIFAYSRTVAFLGETQRGEGFLTLFAFYIIYVGTRLYFEKKEWRITFSIAAALVPVFFVMSLVELAQGVDRPVATFGNTIFLAGYYLFTAVAGMELLRFGRNEKKSAMAWAGGSAAVISILGIFITKSRGVLLGLVVALIAVCVFILIRKETLRIGTRSLKKIAGWFLAVVLVFGGVFYATRTARFWTHIPGLNRIAATDVTNTESRLIYTKMGLEAFRAERTPTRILFGWGWDNFSYIWEKYYDPRVYTFDIQIADRSHDKLVDMLTMTGVLGLLAYLALWYFYFRQSYRLANTQMFVSLLLVAWGIAYFVQNLFVFDTLVTFYAFYTILGYVGYLHDERLKEHN